MSRRDNAERRCEQCKMHASLCVCDLIPKLSTRTRLVLVIHRSEDRKPTNTGRLAAACLTNSAVVVRGHEGDAEPLPIAEGSRVLLLFPAPDAIPLRELGPVGPVTLVVPDGNWRQASKVRKRVAGLADATCVTLPAGEPSAYRLRAEAHAHGLATLEAIARALEILEGPAVRQAMEAPFRAMVERTLWSRGVIGPHEVHGGIPVGAARHDPGRRTTS